MPEVIAPAAEGGDLDIDPALAACVQLAFAGPHLAPPPEPATRPPLTVSAFGMQLHAATTVDGCDRKQLERLCRYMLRPPFAHDAVQALLGGRVRVHFKVPWRSGAAHADMSPDKLLARLCGLVPPPGFHMTRYFGVFAIVIIYARFCRCSTPRYPARRRNSRLKVPDCEPRPRAVTNGELVKRDSGGSPDRGRGSSPRMFM